MTLSQQNRQRLAGLSNDLRPDWEAALTMDGIVKLDQAHPNDPLLVVALTVAAARNPVANGPAFMLGKSLDSGPAEAVVRQLPPRRDDPECEFHAGTIVNSEGRYACCVQAEREAAEPRRQRPVVAPFRDVAPPPPDFRSKLAAAIEANRRPKEEAAK